MNPFSKHLTLSGRRLAALVLVAGLATAACGSDESSTADSVADTTAASSVTIADGSTVTIADPWSRQPAEGQTVSAVYGTVTNNGDEPITAIGASTPTAGRVELHQVTMNDEGEMSMSEKEGGYTIGAGESFSFEPGGPHIMLLDIDAATYPKSVDMTLDFDNGEQLVFTAEVRAIGNMDEADMDGATDGTDMDMDMGGES